MGTLIALDGLDGSGKSTQTNLLVDRLKIDGYAVRTISFPMYDSESSGPVRMYLDGKLGSRPSDTNAYAASAFYSVDRYASYKKVWQKWYQDGGLVVSDRYTTSNAVHQTSKEPPQRQQAFLQWLYDFEYDKLGLPRPDLVIYLDVPTDFTEKLMRHREETTHTHADIHEQDSAYLAACRRAGRAAAEYYGWMVIQCVKDGKMRTIEDIHEEIYRHVAACLEENL